MERDPIVAEALESRFWPFVQKTEGCWLWTRKGVDTNGYGSIVIKGERISVHRLSYVLANGEIPEGSGYHGTCVLHTCDTPRCVNPAHLRLGTQQDNIADRDRKGRLAPLRGERHGCSKLSTEQVKDIRASRLSGYKLAPLYGVNPSTINRIKSGYNWSHV